MISLKAPIPLDFSVQNQVMYSNLPPPLDGQMQMADSLLVYIASFVSHQMPNTGDSVCEGGGVTSQEYIYRMKGDAVRQYFLIKWSQQWHYYDNPSVEGRKVGKMVVYMWPE
jgi:hypothetical protein